MDDFEIDVEPIGDGIAIHLPDRKLGEAKKAGWVVIGLAVVGTLFLIGWIATPIMWGVDLIQQGQVFGWLFVAFGSLGLGGLYASVKFMTLGFSILREKTHCSITITDDKIVSREKFGWFSFKREVFRDDVQQLFIVPVSAIGRSRDETSDNRSAMSVVESFFGGDTSHFHAITNLKREGKMIAPGYSREILDSVATAMADELNRHSTDSVLIVRQQVDAAEKGLGVNGPVTVENMTEEDVDRADFILPDDSELEVIDQGDSTIYRIPERTLLKGTSGLFLLSLFWNGFMLIFTMGFIFGNAADWGVIAIIASFWIVGIGLFVGSVYMARQSALIGVKEGLLFIERKTIFGTKWTEFSAEEVESIEMGHSNITVNDVPVMNLQVAASDQKPVGMFSHLDNAEIQWLAQQLRRSLSIDSRSNRFAVLDFDPTAPISRPSTDIEVQQDADRTTIIVPPFKFKGSATLMLTGLAFLATPAPFMIAWMYFWGWDWTLVLFSILFSIAGAVMFFTHRMLTTRNYLVTATSNQLDVEVSGFMPRKGISATREDVLVVDVVDSKAKLNDQSLYCVRVKTAKGNTLTMMTGRDEKELVYVARLIHQRLKLIADGTS